MIAVRDTGADAFLAEIDDMGGASAKRYYHADLGNDATDENGHPYPVYLDAAEAYDVIGTPTWVAQVDKAISDSLSAGEPLTTPTIRAAMGSGTDTTVEHLQDYTAETKEAAFAGGPRRPVHPTGLADLTRRLVNGYFSRVDGGAVKRYPNAGAGFVQTPSGGRPF